MRVARGMIGRPPTILGMSLLWMIALRYRCVSKSEVTDKMR
jgi:hypothetical protein